MAGPRAPSARRQHRDEEHNEAHDQRDHLETVAGGVLRDAWVDVLAAVEVLAVAIAKLACLFDGHVGLVLDDVHARWVAAGAGNLTAEPNPARRPVAR